MNKLTISAIIIYLLSMGIPISLGADTRGFYALITGWLGFGDKNTLIGLSWSANITFLVAIIIRNCAVKFTFAITTVILALFALTFKIPDVGYVGLGYYIWLSSFVLLLTDAAIKLYQKVQLTT